MRSSSKLFAPGAGHSAADGVLASARGPSATKRLDHWRSERLRLLKEVADDPTDARKLRSAMAANLVEVESFIRYYEAPTVSRATAPNVHPLPAILHMLGL
jgi:hypothetical protein